MLDFDGCLADLEFLLMVTIQIIPVFLTFLVANIERITRRETSLGLRNIITVVFFGIVVNIERIARRETSLGLRNIIVVVFFGIVMAVVLLLAVLAAVVVIKASPQRRGYHWSPIRLHTESLLHGPQRRVQDDLPGRCAAG
jgi:hypothetical protein